MSSERINRADCTSQRRSGKSTARNIISSNMRIESNSFPLQTSHWPLFGRQQTNSGRRLSETSKRISKLKRKPMHGIRTPLDDGIRGNGFPARTRKGFRAGCRPLQRMHSKKTRSKHRPSHTSNSLLPESATSSSTFHSWLIFLNSLMSMMVNGKSF